MSDPTHTLQSHAFKVQGNNAFAAKLWDSAIHFFDQAIDLDPSSHVLWSNRSAAKAAKKDWEGALKDAEECIKANSSWGKGYLRKGAALHGAKLYDDAIAAYQVGINLDDSPALRKGLQDVRDAKAYSDEPAGLGKLFSDPNILAKLAGNPRTAKHLADPGFMQKLQFIQKNPRLADSALQDPRMIDVLGALMGIDLQASTRPEGSTDIPQGVEVPHTPSESPSPPPPSNPKSTTRAPDPQPTLAAEDFQMDDDDDDDEEAQAKKAAEVAREAGGAAYKNKQFDEAIKQYDLAWNTWPKNLAYLTNLGAAYFEKGDYDKCIEVCEKATDEGRSLRADFKLIAKALGRAGSAYQKKGDLASAIKYYQKSLSEHRTPDILNKLREIERLKAEEDRTAYVDPEKSTVAREDGNTKFKAGDFAGAVKDYTESIKRDPSDPRGYNNRAAAYMKLVAFPEALKDVNEAIKVDLKFVKAYIRKANILQAMRDYPRALEAVQEASEHDVDHQHRKEISQTESKIQQGLFSQQASESQEETLQRAMRDPEVAAIMSDPVMQQILQQAQSDPKALQDHLKNPMIQKKIQKLVNAGIIRTR